MTRILDVVLITLGDPGRLTGGYLYHRRMADLAPRYQARLRFVSFPERPFPLAILDAPGVLGRALSTGAQAIVVDSIAAAYLGPWLFLRPPRVPVVGMLHQPPGGIDYGPVRTAIQRRLDLLAHRAARRLMVASEALRDQLVAEGIPRGKLSVVPPGRDVSSSVLLPPGDPRMGRAAAFVCVGNWVERKGILQLLDAFAELPAGAATLHLAGDTGGEPRYAARVRDRLSQPDLSGRVVVHGPLPVGEVAGLYAAGDAFVLPSLKEPYGTVYGEAMAFGLPVVGWRAGNLPYLAKDGQEGLIVPPGDIAGLTNALRRLAEDKELRKRLGEAARARALTRPTWEQSADLFFNLIRQLAERSPRPTSRTSGG